MPHELGARVRIKRHRHGWEDSRISAKVTERYQRPTGSWGYVVTDDSGCEYQINATRDLVPDA